MNRLKTYAETYRDFIVKTKTNLYTKRVYKITVKEGAVFCGRMVKK